MKKVVSLGLCILLVLSLTSCIGKEEGEYIDTFCAIEYENRTLYIDGNYLSFIDELSDNEWDKKINHDWWRLFFQFDDLYPLLRNQEYNDYITVDYDQLLSDIDSIEYLNGAIEVDSTITLNYKQGLNRCSKEIDVYYYNLWESYNNLYSNGSLYDYGLDIDPSGNYIISYNRDGILYRYGTHIDDSVDFVDGDFRIDVERKFLGFDFIYYYNEEIVYRTHIYNTSNYFHHPEEPFLSIDDNDVMWTYHYIKNDANLRTGFTVGNPYEVTLKYGVDDRNIIKTFDLELHQTITDNTLEYFTVMITLVDEGVIEIRYNQTGRSSIYRTIIE